MFKRWRNILSALLIMLLNLLLPALDDGDDRLKNFVLVEGGSFEMGSLHENDEKPLHQVELDSFYISKYELTVAEYLQFLNESGALYEHAGAEHSRIHGRPGAYRVRPGEEGYPVVYVSWFDARAYIDWLNRRTGKRFRLPTEAEWEFAARGGQFSRGYLYSGGDDVDRVAWYFRNSGGSTQAVGLKEPNELGLYDMSGNVWEWCSDWYERDYYAVSPVKNPRGPGSGLYRVDRGGSWSSDPAYLRAANRGYGLPQFRVSVLGFRLALDADKLP